MSSTNISGRPTRYIPIPVEIVSQSNSTNSNFNDTSYNRARYDSSFNNFSNSPPWKIPSRNTYSRSHIQPRQTQTSAYDRLIKDSHFNRPINDGNFFPSHEESYRRPLYKRSYETTSLHTSRSSDDLLSTPSDFISSNSEMRNTSYFSPRVSRGFQADSDFVQPHTNSSFLRRSFDMLNDYSDTHQQNPSQQQPSNRTTYVTTATINPKVVYSSEYNIPTNYHQSNKTQGILNNSQDQSESPASHRDESLPQSSQSNSQRPQESDFKVSTDATGSMTGQCTTSSSNDQQVPSTDTPVSTTIPSIPIRDSNTIALEKLEQIKQNLADLNEQVDAFNGSTRDDRAYKVLDEKALKMMISCDALTDVSVDIKEKRKAMIRNVQNVLEKLESKVPIIATTEDNSNQLGTDSTTTNQSSANSTTQQQQASLNQTEETRTE